MKYRQSFGTDWCGGHAPFILWMDGVDVSWWRHQMEIFYALLALCEGNPPVTGEFPPPKPVTRSFDVLFDLRQNKRLGK